MEPIEVSDFRICPPLSPKGAGLRVVAREYIEAMGGRYSFETLVEDFYCWLELSEHADLHARWFEAAETVPEFRDGDIPKWEWFMHWVFNYEAAEWRRRRGGL